MQRKSLKPTASLNSIKLNQLKAKLLPKLLGIGLPGIMFMLGTTIFAVWIFCTKLNYIYSFSNGELARLAEVSNFSEFITHPRALILGASQALLLKLNFITPESALRIPVGFLLALSLILFSRTLILLKRSKLEVAIFFLLAIFSPFLIFSAHRGSSLWIETIFLLSLSSCSLTYLSSWAGDSTKKGLSFTFLALSLGLLLLNPFGAFMAVPFVVLIFLNPQIRASLENIGKPTKWSAITIFCLLLIVAILLGALNLNYLKYIAGLEVIKAFSNSLNLVKDRALVALGLGAESYALGLRLLWVSVLAIAGFGLLAIKNQLSKKSFAIGLGVAVIVFLVALVPDLLGGYALLILSLNWFIAVILAAAYSKLDSIFPINPYPRVFGSFVLMSIVCCIVIFSTRVLFWQTLRHLAQ